MKFIFLVLIFNTLFFFKSISQNVYEISEENIKAHISYLASDKLEGRKPGTISDSLSADYIYNQFKKSGLNFFKDDAFQKFEIISGVTIGSKDCKLDGQRLIFKDEYFPHYNSPEIKLNAEIIFASYGIETENKEIDNYKNIDVKDKWVMVVNGFPENYAKDSKPSNLSGINTKIVNAKDKGAAGLIIISTEKNPVNNKYQYGLTYGLPLIVIPEKTADLILKKRGNKINNIIKKLAKNKEFEGFNTKSILDANIEITTNKVTTQNIVGYIEGNDERYKNQYIVIGAHFDHLGMGGEESSSRMPDTIAVHNGADDNASGTAGVIELARKLSTNKSSLKRSIIICAFSAEEIGLLGSKYFVNNLPINKDSIVFMANFDMIGRYTETLQLLCASSAKELDSLIKISHTDTTLKIKPSLSISGGSDQSSFYYENIPCLFFFTGMHSDYHTPLDDVEKINFEGEKKILDYSYNLIQTIDNYPDKLTFVKSSGKGEGNARNNMKVTLGIMPDFTSSENNGLIVGGVTKDGPADKSGMLKGDLIISINGKKIENVYDYMSRLGELKSGQKISVDIIRNKENKTLKVQL